MKIFAISDTHRKHANFIIPKCDVFVYAGDFSDFRSKKYDYDKFNNWTKDIDAGVKLLIAGNHDTLIFQKPSIINYLHNYIYLKDKIHIVNNIKFYGFPWMEWFYDHLYGNDYLNKKTIPNDIDVLITHAPPYQILDIDITGKNYGSKFILDAVFKIQPKIHIFGHVHASGGRYKKIGNTTFYNVAGKGMEIDL